MIPRDYITAWRVHAPWANDAQVEQDLVISRTLVELFRVPELASELAFRGGTALYKLFLTPPPRYSEDIDLVQVRSEPIGNTLDQMRTVLDPWLGSPRWKLKKGRVNLVYRFESEDQPPLKLRLKIEINTREHYTELELESVPFYVYNPWFSGLAKISTYALDELLGTKLRALYQPVPSSRRICRESASWSTSARTWVRYFARVSHGTSTQPWISSSNVSSASCRAIRGRVRCRICSLFR